MGRGRKKSGVGKITYDIFGNVVGQTPDVPKPAAPNKPAPAPTQTNRLTIGGTSSANVEKADAIIASASSQVDRKRKKEMAVLLDENGRVVTVLDGRRHSVSLSMSAAEERRTAYLTHNHPDVVTFSPNDMRRLGDMNLVGIQAQAIPMTDKEHATISAALDIMVDEIDRYVGFFTDETLKRNVTTAITQMRDLFRNASPTARNLTFTAAHDGDQASLASRNLRRAMDTLASQMERNGLRKLVPQVAFPAWMEMVMKAGLRTGNFVTDSKEVVKVANFLANAIGQHVMLQALWTQHAPADTTYSVTLT